MRNPTSARAKPISASRGRREEGAAEEKGQMELRHFGPSRRAVPAVGQGTWEIESNERDTAIAALRRGIDLGMTHVDTAEMYGSGAAEELVGEAIDGVRDKLFLVSKVLPGHASREGTIKACEQSLLRLGTDRLDCYLLHWRGSYPLEQTIEAFEQLASDGKILFWGVSNFDVPDLEEAIEIAGEGRLTCNQVIYHLQERAIEHAVLPWCEQHEVALVAYSPFGHGNFPSPQSAGGRILQEIAQAHGATPREVALRFLLRRESLFAIPKSSTPEHAAENARAGHLQLSDDEIARIDQAFPLGPRPRTLPML